MATEKRQPYPSVIDRLFEEWYGFSFFQAVKLLEQASPNKKQLGKTSEPGAEAVRFSVHPGFSFPASDIRGLAPGGEDGPAKMVVAFLGLIGPSGVLPHWYNELAERRLSQKDSSLTAFFDIFHHRLATLFYLAWKKHQFPVNFRSGASDRLSGHLLALCGLNTPGLHGRIGFAEESLSFYSGLFSRQIPSGSAIESAAEHFSGQQARIEQFVERLIPLDDIDMTRLGRGHNELGVSVLCGSHVWECQTKFRVNLGPMTLLDFVRFLPSGDMLAPIFSLIRYMVGVEYEFEIRISLARREVPVCMLGNTAKIGTRLGWTTWLKSGTYMHEEDQSITFHEVEKF